MPDTPHVNTRVRYVIQRLVPGFGSWSDMVTSDNMGHDSLEGWQTRWPNDRWRLIERVTVERELRDGDSPTDPADVLTRHHLPASLTAENTDA